MLFNSYTFVLLFLPLCIIGYYILNYNKKYEYGLVFLVIMSLWFYGYYNLWYLFIIIGSVFLNYLLYRVMQKVSGKKTRKTIMIVGLIANLMILGYFKYTDFLIKSANFVFKAEIPLLKIALPLGISFFTFQQLSFIVDVYENKDIHYGFFEYACFVTFFPQLVAGPIVTHDEVVPQFQDLQKKKIDWDKMAQGIYIFAIGLSKKVLIADMFGKAANIGFSDIRSLDTTNAVITVLAYTIQIYFDFSGYCDMAIGIGNMLNIDLPLNFNSPYKALTITEFWDRWHMTLTRFFTKYIYIPLGGNRRGWARTYINIFIVFFLSGLWHGAGINFIIWGMGHGCFSIFTRHFKKYFNRLHPALNWIITFSFVNIMWVFFRAGSLKDALHLINRIAQGSFGTINTKISNAFYIDEIRVLLDRTAVIQKYPYFSMFLFFLLAGWMLLGCENSYEKMKEFKPTKGRLISSLILMVWSVFSFSGVSTFLYFNF